MTEEKLNIRNTTKQRTPTLPFEAMKNAALGKDYELSLVFCGDKLSRRLNRKLRVKDKPTNVLSYEIDPKLGEIVICLPRCRREHAKFGRTFGNFVGFLFIHGLFHLKGLDHGSRMEHEESKLCKRFGI